MERVNINYSLKNIGIPSQIQYKKVLVEKTVNFIDRLRKKVHFIKNPTQNNNKETFGFKSNWRPKTDPDIKRFEDDLWEVIENVQFNRKTTNIQQTIKNDLINIKNDKKVIIKGDKSNFLYKSEPHDYKKNLRDQVTNLYKKCPANEVDSVNKEAAKIVDNFDIADRVDAMGHNTPFLTAKDHKQNFETRPQFRLINRSKTNVGIISKQILDKINSQLREKQALTNGNPLKLFYVGSVNFQTRKI